MPPPEVSSEVLLQHAAFVRRLAGSLVGDASTADDLAQEAWLAAVRSPPGPDLPARGWLSTVLKNAARKWRRGEGRRARRERACARGEATRSVEEQVARDETIRAVIDAVLRLDLPQRTVVTMRFYEDLPPRTIAERLGIPVNTVKSRLRLAVERLRRDLDGRQESLRSDWRALLATSMGGVAMGAKTKVAVVGGVALVLGVGVYSVLDTSGSSRPDPLNASTQDARSEVPSGEDPTLSGTVVASAPTRTAEVVSPASASPAGSETPLGRRPGLTIGELARMGLTAQTPPDTLEAIVIDDVTRTPVESGRGFLWVAGTHAGPEGIPTGAEPVDVRSISRGGTFRFEKLANQRWYLGIDLGDGVRRLSALPMETGRDANPRSVLLLGDSSIEGLVYDETGRAAAGLRVRVSARDAPGALGATHVETRTDAQGRYAAERLPSGGGWVSVAYSGDLGDPRATRTRGITLLAGERVRADFGSPGGTPLVKGTLRCSDGAPVLGERRILLSPEGSREYVEIPLDPKGQFEQRVPAGTYRVHVWHAAAVLEAATESTRLEVPLVVGDRDLTVDLVLPGTRITGVVRASSEGTKPRWVGLARTEPSGKAPANIAVEKDGSFRCHGILPGRYTLVAGGVAGESRVTSDPVDVTVTVTDVEIRQDLVLGR